GLGRGRAEGFDGIDHFVSAWGRLADDPAGLRALRQWLERGGKVWVMLDLVDPEVVAPLLGDALDFQVVDRVGLTNFAVQEGEDAQPPEDPQAGQVHERPGDFVRVLLPPQEGVRPTLNRRPAWFPRQVGGGKVVFTTLGPRGWHRPRRRADPRPSFDNFPNLPVETAALTAVAEQLHPPEEETFR